jgi:hypothetical protein
MAPIAFSGAQDPATDMGTTCNVAQANDPRIEHLRCRNVGHGFCIP